MHIGHRKKEPKAEMNAYKKMRDMFEDFYKRIQAARLTSGKRGFNKQANYFTFMNDLAEMERQGIHPIHELSVRKADRWMRPTLTGFPFAKPRKKFAKMQKLRKKRGIKEHPLELDAFAIMERYAPSVRRFASSGSSTV